VYLALYLGIGYPDTFGVVFVTMSRHMPEECLLYWAVAASFHVLFDTSLELLPAMKFRLVNCGF